MRTLQECKNLLGHFEGCKDFTNIEEYTRWAVDNNYMHSSTWHKIKEKLINLSNVTLIRKRLNINGMLPPAIILMCGSMEIEFSYKTDKEVEEVYNDLRTKISL